MTLNIGKCQDIKQRGGELAGPGLCPFAREPGSALEWWQIADGGKEAEQESWLGGRI